MQIDKHAARELALYADNTESVYNTILASAKRSLTRRILNGTYDPVKATKFWQNCADYAARCYVNEYCEPSANWRTVFNAPTRRLAAAEIAENFDEIIRS